MRTGDWVNVWQGIWSPVSCSLLFRAEFNHDQLLWTGLKDIENHRQDSLDLYSPNISFQKVLNIPKLRGFAISSFKPWGCHKFNDPEVASNKHLVLSVLLTAVHGEFMILTWLCLKKWAYHTPANCMFEMGENDDKPWQTIKFGHELNCLSTARC